VSDSGPAVFDAANLEERMMGNTALVCTILESFLSDMPQQIRAMINFVQAGETHHAGQQAHKITGAAASVGGEALRGLASEIESAAKGGDLNTLVACTGRIDEQFLRLKAAIEGHVAAKRTKGQAANRAGMTSAESGSPASR
jgi:HPt (histidine-containing phosphotransfer) domain-containing protein